MEELLVLIDPVVVLVVLTATTGATELVKRLFRCDFEAAAVIAIASLVGSFVGMAVGVAWYYGLVLGLSASGLVTVTSKFGTKGNK